MRHSHLSSQATMLVAHGSPDPRSAPVARTIAAFSRAHATFLDFDTPHPLETVESLVRKDVGRVQLVPLLLTRAYHGRVDIPQVAETARERWPDLAVSVTDPVGGAALLPTLARNVSDTAYDALVLAAAGTRDTEALAEIENLAVRLSRLTGVPTQTGYASAAQPSIDDAVLSLRDQGAYRVAVASYFIAPGFLHDRVCQRAYQAGAVTVGAPLGAAGELVRTIVERRQATPVASLTGRESSSPAVTIPHAQAAIAGSHNPATAR